MSKAGLLDLEALVRSKEKEVSDFRRTAVQALQREDRSLRADSKDKFSDWDDFDRINFIQFDDDGDISGVEIGGH